MSASAPLLQIEGLRTHFFTKAGVVKAVDDVSLTLERGRILGIVGESGSGKSMLAYSIMGLVDAPGRIVSGRIALNGIDLAGLDEPSWRRLRGARVAMVFQDPMMTLNPVLRIDTQMVEAVRAHHAISHESALERAREALSRVGIASPDERLRNYPHQFSGGMRQRVAIAIALINRPDLVIADEPTTALDVTIQGQILSEMQALCRDAGTGLIWITHDLSVIAGLADEVCVMYAGRVVEAGPVDDVLDGPRHPYTRGLLDSVPSRNVPGKPLSQIRGAMPSLLALAPGCAFRERCARSLDACRAMPVLAATGSRSLRCVNPLP